MTREAWAWAALGANLASHRSSWSQDALSDGAHGQATLWEAHPKCQLPALPGTIYTKPVVTLSCFHWRDHEGLSGSPPCDWRQ